MADIHNALRRGNLSRGLTAVLGDTRQGGLERFGETMQPVIDLWSRPEFFLMRDELLLGVASRQTAVVAQNTAFQLRNPPGSKVVAVLEAIFVASLAGPAIAFEVGVVTNQADLATVEATISRDGRTLSPRGTGSLLKGVCRVSRTTNIAGANQIARMRVLNETTYKFDQPIVLGPDTQVRVTTIDVNVGADCSFLWRERQGYPSERVDM